ncbi:MAG: putative O-glycosylation ligase, exosortase A system-associated [Gammaproteobacteria bacterium]
MRDLFILMLVAGSLPLILSRPWIGILVWSWLGYMNPHRLAWGFAYDFPFALLVGLTTLIAMIFYKGEKHVRVIPILVLWIFFIFWMNVTTFTALNSFAIHEWDRTMKIMLFSVLTMVLIRNKKQVETLVWMIVFSLGFFGVKGGVFSILTGGNYLVWGPPGSFINGNNALGLAMVMTLPLMFYLYEQASDKRIKLALLGVMALTSVSILTTHSRGAFLALASMGVVLWYYSSRKFIIGCVLVVAAIFLWNSMPQDWRDRIMTIQTYEQDGSAMGRINAWRFAINLANDHPLTGGGYGTYTPELFLRYAPEPDDFHDAHSIYFEVLAEHGYVGLVLFLLIGAGVILTSARTISIAKRREDLAWVAALSRMMIVSLCAYAVGGAFLGLAYFDLYWHFVAMAVILRQICMSPPDVEEYTAVSSQLDELEVKGAMNAPAQPAVQGH